MRENLWKKHRNKMLIVALLLIGVANFFLNLSGNQGLLAVAAKEEQLAFISENQAFFLAFYILAQVVVVITLTFAEALLLCVLRSRISKRKLRFKVAEFSALLGNLAVSVYTILFVFVFQIRSIRGLLIFNLLPFGLILKTIVIFAALKRESGENAAKIDRREILVFLSAELLFSAVGYFYIL